VAQNANIDKTCNNGCRADVSVLADGPSSTVEQFWEKSGDVIVASDEDHISAAFYFPVKISSRRAPCINR
jgi:hypothetical protein